MVMFMSESPSSMPGVLLGNLCRTSRKMVLREAFLMFAPDTDAAEPSHTAAFHLAAAQMDDGLGSCTSPAGSQEFYERPLITASSISSVSRPVNVFCCETW